MSLAVDARPVAGALKSAIGAEVAPNSVYEYRQVPGADSNAGVLPSIFVLLSIERRQNIYVRMTARTDVSGWRVATRCAGRTVDECRWAMNRVARALDGQVLEVADQVSTPIQFESDEAPAWDDGRFTAVSMWTFSL